LIARLCVDGVASPPRAPPVDRNPAPAAPGMTHVSIGVGSLKLSTEVLHYPIYIWPPGIACSP
jgi:hypothetical protein